MSYLRPLDLVIQSLDDERLHVQITDGQNQTERIASHPLLRGDPHLLLGLLEHFATRSASHHEQQRLRLFGLKLHEAAFGTNSSAAQGPRALRFHTAKAGRLAFLPWELLCHPQDGYLALNGHTVSRFDPQVRQYPPVPLIGPLQTLMVAPRPPNFPPQPTFSLLEASHLSLSILPRATWPTLQRALLAKDFHILVLDAYVDADPTGAEAYLSFEDDRSPAGSFRLSASELGSYLGPTSTVRLIVLRLHPALPQPLAWSSHLLAYTLQRTGVAAVIVNQASVSADAWQMVITESLGRLAGGHPVETAARAARVALAARIHGFAWASILQMGRKHLFVPLKNT